MTRCAERGETHVWHVVGRVVESVEKEVRREEKKEDGKGEYLKILL